MEYQPPEEVTIPLPILVLHRQHGKKIGPSDKVKKCQIRLLAEKMDLTPFRTQ